MLERVWRWLQQWLPEGRRADGDWRRRALLLLSVCAVFVVLTPLFAALAWLRYGQLSGALVSLGCGALAAGTFPLLRRTGSLALCSSVVLGMMAAAIFGAALGAEGLASPALAWIASLPLFAAGVAGRRAAVGWAAALSVAVAALAALDRYGLAPGRLLPPQLHKEAAAWNWVLLTFFVSGVALVYEALRRRTEDELQLLHRELAKAREQQLLADRLASLGTLAAGVAHEINNPLTTISANAQLLAHELGRSGVRELESAAADTHAAAMRVAAIVRSLREYNHPPELEPRSSRVAEGLDHALKQVPTALRSTATVVADVAQAPPVKVPPARLGQLLLDLLLNAHRAMPSPDATRNRIVVSARAELERVVLEVQDNGVGMSDDVRRRVFDPFFTTRPVGTGLGLGLFVAHAIVSGAQGHIAVESEPGRGSTFRVELPRAPSA